MSVERIEYLDVNDLLLDERNPRLPSTVGRKQDEMLRYIARTTSISEIMSAIAENDYFPGEPLVVLPNEGKSKKKKYIVVEGNRRLTALMLLQDPTLYPKNRRVQEIAESADFRPTSIPCVIFEARGEVVNYLGYRHITGVKQWEPLAKARYIGSYFDELTPKDDAPIERYREVARAIGSTAPYIKRQLDGLAAYNVLEDKNFFEIEDLDEENISFSLLTTALGYDAILSFVATETNIYADPSSIRVPNVQHLCKWLFEPNERGETVLGDSRNIQRLAVIAADKAALHGLISGDSIDKAYSVTKGISEDLNENLIGIESQISRVVSMIALVQLEESHIERIENIYKQSRLLKRASED